MKFKSLIFIFIFLSIVIFTDSNFYQFFIYALSLYFFLELIEKLGEKIILLDTLAFLAIIQWLLGAAIFNSIDIPFAVPFEKYYLIAIPGTLFFIFGLKLPAYIFRNKNNNRPILKRNLESYYSHNLFQIKLFFWLGLGCLFLERYVSIEFNFVVKLLSYLLFVSLGALFFCKIKFKRIYFILGILAIIYNTLLNGMIGVIVFFSFTLFNVYTISKPIIIPFFKKIIIILFLFFTLLSLQLAKTEYRKLTWIIVGDSGVADREIVKDPILFLSLLKDRFLKIDYILNKDVAAEFVQRFNQGYTISQAINYVPSHEPYANGEITILGPLFAFVPRIIWYDKPEIGTSSYFERFTGIELGQFNSVTLGALGDAYVDYGYYSFIFLFFYGLLFGKLYVYFFLNNFDSPFKILWGQVLVLCLLSFPEVSVTGLLNFIFKFMLFFILVRYLQNLLYNKKQIKCD